MRKNLNIDLSSLDNYLFALQENKSKLKEKLLNHSLSWAEGTKKDYIGRITYASGFSKLRKNAYMAVEEANSGGLYIAVGHAAFIAKFLEVGTHPHEIVHKTKGGNGYAVAKVNGIKGNKALGKAFAKRRKEFAKGLQEEINKVLRGEI